MSKEYKKMKKKELLGLCAEREIEPAAEATKKHIIGLLERNDRVMAGTQVCHPTEQELKLSETPVIDGEQANVSKMRTIATIGDPPTIERTADAVQMIKPDVTYAPTMPGTEIMPKEIPIVPEKLPSEIPARMPATMADIPVTPRPVVEKEPEPVEPIAPVICAGCKATVESDTTRACLDCTGSLVFCPTCAKPGTCHKCGKGLK